MIIAMMRVRNEELVMRDTLRHAAEFADGIVVYDDASTDSTRDIVEGSDAPVLELIRGTTWTADRQAAETEHRRLLVEAAERYAPTWLVYLDADERIDGNFRAELRDMPKHVGAVRLSLLDAYLSPGAAEPYRGGSLAALERQYGPEVRHILMAWRANATVHYMGRDRREPVRGLQTRSTTAKCEVKHFGKAISVEQWEATCDYYTTYFPEPYRSKWAARRGAALHTLSDFGRPLHNWPVPESERHSIDPSPSLRSVGERFVVTVRGLRGGVCR